MSAARAQAGRIVDGHGDLLADDIFCLDDGPRILDCLDFDDRLRWVDGLDDAAFLAMDLERLGAPGLAEQFTGWYAEYSGDPAPTSLRHHYTAYRSLVRAKVDFLRAIQGDPEAAAVARQLLGMALKHLRAAVVTLVMVGGLPGTGKSALSAAIAGRFGFTALSSDQIRKELAGVSPDDITRLPNRHHAAPREQDRRLRRRRRHRRQDGCRPGTVAGRYHHRHGQRHPHHPRRRARAADTGGAQRHPPARPRAHLAAHPAVHAARVTLEQRRLRDVAAKVISLAATFWAAL